MATSTTSNTHKNSYGVKKKRKRRKTKRQQEIYRIASEVYDQKEQDEVELKYFDRAEIDFAAIDNAGSIYSLSNTITQGVGVSQRVGDSIKLKSLNFRIEVRGNLGSGDYHNMRVFIVRWFSDGTPAVADLLAFTTNTQLRHLCQLNMNNTSHFKVLYDNTFSVGRNSTDDLPEVINDKFYLALRGEARWIGGGGTTPERGHVYLVAISDSASVDAPQLNATIRLRYTDS